MIATLFILFLQAIDFEYIYDKPYSHFQEFGFKDSLNITEICFYSNNKNRCPSNINQSNIFGPNEYDSQLLSISKNSVKIHIVDPIFLTKPIIFSAPVNFYLVGDQINGNIEVHEKTSIDIQDPTKTEIKLYWSVSSKEISQVNTLLQAKSIFIQIVNQNESISQYKLHFYTGKETNITLSTLSFKDINYSIYCYNHNYFIRIKKIKYMLNEDSTTLSESISGSFSGNLQYHLNPNLTLLIINGKGEMNDFTDISSRPWDYCSNTIVSVIIESGVTSIGNYAFSDLHSLISVTFPSTVTKIGKSVFSNCISLWDITLPERLESIGDRLFYNCNSLAICVIPQKVTQIPDYTFFNCTELIYVNLHSKVTSIGDYSFYCCINLTDLTFSEEITSISNYAFYNCSRLESFEITEKIVSIGDFAFFGCNGIKTMKISEKVTYIGTGSFSNCNNFELFEISENNEKYKYESNCIISKNDNSLLLYINNTNIFEFTIFEKVTSISGYAFYNQVSLTSIVIPETVTSIGDYAFYYCVSITDFTIPNSVTSIGKYSFYHCTSLSQIKISENLVSIGDYAFYECLLIKEFLLPPTLNTIGAHAFSFCDSLNKIEIDSNNQFFTVSNQGIYSSPSYDLIFYPRDNPNTNYEVHSSCTKICTYALSYCKYLQSVTMSDSVTTIEDFAFYKDTELQSVQLSNNLISIGKYAFGDCKKLKKINFPDTINSIDDYAFYKAGVSSLKIPDQTSFIGEGAFYDSSLFSIFFESSSYKRINKLTFADMFNLQQVNLTENIEFIDPKAFHKSQMIKSYNIIGTNANFKSIDGILHSIDGTHLIKFPAFKTIEYPGLKIEETVTTIDEYAFSYVTGLRIFSLPNYIVEIKEGAFCGSALNIFRSFRLKSVGKYAFSYCSYLTDVNFEYLPEIPEGSFYECPRLEKIDFGSSNITTIGDYAFAECYWTEEIIFPKNLQVIGHYAFYGCRSIVNAYNIKDSFSRQTINKVRFIGDFAFYECKKINFSIQCNCDYVGKYAFYKTSIQNIYINCSYIGAGAFQESGALWVDFLCENDLSIGQDLFYGCSNITHLNLTTNNIRAIPNHFCYNCVSLTSFISPSSINYFGRSSFENCIKLVRLTIKSELSYIGSLAFANCTVLSAVSYDGEYEPKYSPDAFLNSNQIRLVSVTDKYTEHDFCGFDIWINENVTNENTTFVKPPVYKYLYVDIEDDKYENPYYFDIKQYSAPNDNEVIVLRLNKAKYDITHIIVNNEKINKAGILIPKEYSELTITGDDEDTNYSVNLITTGNPLNLSFSHSVQPRFNNTKGQITVNCTDCVNDTFLNISFINPSEGDEPFTLIPLTTTYVDSVNFDKNNTELIVDNDVQYLISVNIRNITVQQFVNAKISNCNVFGRIRFGIGSTLSLNETVNLDGCKVEIPFNIERKTLPTSYIKGELVDFPGKIEINTAIENVYLLDNDDSGIKEVLIAESDQSFYCNAWISNIVDKLDSLDFKYYCVKEKIDDANIYRLYGKQNTDKPKKKSKISSELFVVIIASCIAFVVIVVSILVYIFFIRKRKIGGSFGEQP